MSHNGSVFERGVSPSVNGGVTGKEVRMASGNSSFSLRATALAALSSLAILVLSACGVGSDTPPIQIRVPIGPILSVVGAVEHDFGDIRTGNEVTRIYYC